MAKKGYYNGWKTVQAEDRKSDQATYGEVCCVFFMVYQCKLVKYNNDEEEVESTDVYFHSSTKRLFSMEEFDTEYG